MPACMSFNGVCQICPCNDSACGVAISRNDSSACNVVAQKNVNLKWTIKMSLFSACMLLKCANIFFATFSIDGFKLVAAFISENCYCFQFWFFRFFICDNREVVSVNSALGKTDHFQFAYCLFSSMDLCLYFKQLLSTILLVQLVNYSSQFISCHSIQMQLTS